MFHPLFGRDFEFVAHRQDWGEDRVHLHGVDGELFSLPAGWTDVVPADPFVVVADGGTRVIRTPARSPRANAFAERFVGTLRRQCLDHMLILGEQRLRSVLTEYAGHYNGHRPHQGLQQEPPQRQPGSVVDITAWIERRKVLGGLITEYHRAALASEKLLLNGHRRVLARHTGLAIRSTSFCRPVKCPAAAGSCRGLPSERPERNQSVDRG